MTQLLDPPPSRSRRRRRLPLPRLSANPEVRSTQIGVLGTLLVHLLLFLLAPHLLRLESGANRLPRVAPPQQFNVELLPDVQMQPQQVPVKKPPLKFVEVNPDAPDNVPDKTNNTGAQNQQAAQEKPSDDMTGDRPAIEGQTKIKTDQIVSGSLAPPIPPRPSGPPIQSQAQKPAAKARREQTPLGGYEKFKGDAEDSYGSNIAKISEHADKVEKEVKGQKNAPTDGNAMTMTPRINPMKPQPRPRLEQRARPAIFTENKIGTSNIGPVAVDARWSNYAQYLQQLIETVQVQWERILTQSMVYPASGSMVTVKFVLDKKGEISRIVGVDGTAGDQARRACVSAITARAPYGDWTDDMVNVLGDEQEMTFRFYYQ